MSNPIHLSEFDFAKLFPASVDEFPEVVNDQHYIDAWLLNSVFNSLLITEQYLLDHKANIEAPAGADIVSDDGQVEIPIPAGRYTGYETALAWDSELLEENIKDGVEIFGVVGTLEAGAPAFPPCRYVKLIAYNNWGDNLFGMSSIWLFDTGETKLNDKTMPHTYNGNQVNGTPEEMSNTITTDYWQLNTPGPIWWKVDLGSNHEIHTLKTQSYIGSAQRGIHEFELWGSEDDIDYFLLYRGWTVMTTDLQTFDLSA